MKGFNLTMSQALYDTSYANLIMLGATLPSYDSGKKDGRTQSIKADDLSLIHI